MKVMSNNQGNERQGKVYQSVPVPDKVSMISDTTGDTIGLSQNSQFDKTKSKSRYGWVRNRYIGRRTGKDVRKDKQIRVGKNGMEIFDDYLSESECESFLSGSSNSTRKSIKIDFLTRQENTTNYSKQTDKTGMFSAQHAQDATSTQDKTTRSEVSQQTLTDRSVNVNSYATDENKSNVEKRSERTINGKTSQSSAKQNSSNKENVNSRLHIINGVTDTNSDRQDSFNKENIDGEEEKLEHDGQDMEKLEDGGLDEEEFEDEGPDEEGYEDKGTIEVEEEGEFESNRSEVNELAPNEDGPVVLNHDGETESDVTSENMGRDSEQKGGNDDSEAEESINLNNNGEGDMEDNEEVDTDDEKEEDEAESDRADDALENNEPCVSHASSKKSLILYSSRKLVETSKVKEPLVNCEMGYEIDAIDSHPDEGDHSGSDEPAVLTESREKTDLNKKSGPNSEMLDVAGNKSGSLTKKSELLGNGSDVTFNRSKKRLSYSALEESEEKAKARAKKVEAANKELSWEDTQRKLKQNDARGKSESKQSYQRLDKQQTNNLKEQVEDLDKDTDFLCLSFRSLHKPLNDDNQQSDDTDITIIDDVKTKKNKLNLGEAQRRKSIQTVGKIKETCSSLKTRKSKSERKSLGRGKLVKKQNKTVSKKTKDLNENKESIKKSSKVNRKLVAELEYLETHSDHDCVENDCEFQNDNETSYTDGKFLKDSHYDAKSNAKRSVTKNRKRTIPSVLTESIEVSPPKQRKQQEENRDNDCCDFNFIRDKSIKTYSRNKEENRKLPTVESSDGAEKAIENKKKAMQKRTKKTDTNRKSSTEESADEDKTTISNIKESLQKQSNKAGNYRKSSSEDYTDENRVSKENKKKVSKKQPNKIDKQKKLSADESSNGEDQPIGNRKKATQKQSKKSAKRKGSDEMSHSPGTSPLTSKIRTPEPDTRQISANFQSGLSMRVSRRSEVLENIMSGPHTRGSGINIEMEPIKGLTPCISKKGASRNSKGRRVTICPEENIHHSLSADEASFRRPLNGKQRRSSISLPGDETNLKNFDSTPVHIAEYTKTEPPTTISKLPKGYSELPIEDRLIYPEPAPNGLRRSKRVRLKPVATYKNEEIIRRYEPGVGEVIVGVKPSMETVYTKREEIKRKKRQFKQALKKATEGNQKKPKRKLSIHVDLPKDLMPSESDLISVVNPFTREEDEIDCIACYEDICKVGPSGDPASFTDPYTISVYFDQPCMSSGIIELKPLATKPPSIVGEQAVFEKFTIIEGKVLVKIQNSTTLLETLDSFFVPCGNTYSITNMRNDQAKLSYDVQKYSR